MAEFTGERVVPGLVDADLFNEHVARYRFAARVANGFSYAPAVLDAGCGTGYGAMFFGNRTRVTACDISVDAVRHAAAQAARPNVRYAQADCEALPFADGSFDLICAFEVIEHLNGWRDFLLEARRALRSEGLLLVSTPNKLFYAEARAEAGPNPFHTHEFTCAEFERELRAVFPHVRLWSQNHAGSIVFAPPQPDRAGIDAEGDTDPEHANFFLAVCGIREFALNDLYAWIPSSANVLRERGRHIAKLEGELARKNAWLEKRAAEHSALQAEHETTLLELRERNQWALRQDAAVAQAREHMEKLEAEAAERLNWVAALEVRLESGVREIERLNRHREELERDLAERAAWGFALDAQVKTLSARAGELEENVAELRGERERIAASNWIRLGRRLNLGPQVE